jgi:hypothetical protein
MKLHKNLTGDDLHEPKGHHTSHEDGDTDEIDVTDLSGELADEQKAGFNNSPNNPSVIPDLIQKIRELEFTLSSIETKIFLLLEEFNVLYYEYDKEFPDDHTE